jgi:hypothetical protein
MLSLLKPALRAAILVAHSAIPRRVETKLAKRAT